MARGKQLHHPLVLMFWARRFSIEEGMDWLQSNGHISDLCQTPEEVAPSDVLRILDLAKMPMMASRKYRQDADDWEEQRALEAM